MIDSGNSQSVYESALKKPGGKLDESDAWLRTIFNTVQAGIVIIDPETHRIVDANPAAVSLIGDPKEKIVGSICHNYICPAEVGKCPITDLGETVDHSERVLLSAGGKSRAIIKTATNVALRGRTYLLESFIDISETKKIEEVLQQSKGLFDAVVSQNPSGMIVVDSGGIVKFINPAAESLFGRKADNLVGSVLGLPLVDGESTEIDIILDSGVPGTAEMRVVEIEWLGKPAYLATLFDVTSIKEAGETLKRVNEELRKIDKMKSEFISVASHELRTPLTSIKNAIEILVSKKAGDLTENQEHFLSMAIRNINRLSTMINELLDLRKLEAGKLELQFSEVDIVGTLHQVVSAFKPQADDKLQILTADCSEDVSTVYADPGRVEQILYNLASNAVKFTPTGGTVQLRARKTKMDTEAENTRQDFPTSSPPGWTETPVSEWVEISVTDTGNGISQDDQVRIFEPFYQAGDILTSRSKGSGLGLTIVKELVESQMGQISVESVIGKGSRFFFTLPVFSPQSIEVANLHKEIRQASKDSSLFSLLEICLSHKSLSDLNHREMNGHSDLFNQLMAVVNKIIHRSTDHIIAQQVILRVIIILESTKKKEAAIVKRKLEEAFSMHPIVFEGKTLPVPTVLGPATFPEDGVTSKELLAAVEGKVE